MILIGRGDVLLRFTDTALVSIGNFATSILVGRILGPQQFGVFALLWTVVTLALTAQWASITSPMQFSLAQSQGEAHLEMFGALWYHALILGLFGGLGSACIALWIGITSPATLAVIVAAVLGIIVQDFVRRWLLATDRSGWALVSDGLRQSGSLGILALMSGSVGLTLLLCMLLIGAGAVLGCAPVAPELQAARLRPTAVMNLARRHSAFAKWLMPSVILQTANSAAPLYLLGGALGVAAAGGYRAAVALASPIVILSEALETFLPLRAAQAAIREGPNALWRTLGRSAALFFPLCLSYLVLLYLFGATLIRMTYGPSYQAYVQLLVVLGVASLLQYPGYMLNVALRALRRPNVILAGDVIATIVLVSLLLATTRHATPMKAAVCVVVHQAVKLLVLATAAASRAQSNIP